MSNYSINGKEVEFQWGLQGGTPFETLVSVELPNYVLKIHWTLEASCGENKVSTYGCHEFPLKSKEQADATGDTFIPFEELTSQIVYSWLGSADFANPTKENLVKLLDGLINLPKIEVREIPWL